MDSTASGVPSDVLKRVTGLVFNRPRAYTVVTLGGLDLVLAALRGGGFLRESDRLVDAVLPLVEASGARGVDDLAETLTARNGRPSARISQTLRSDELETALAWSFKTLGWDDLVPHLAVWSPSANRAVDGVVLTVSAALDRRGLVLDLARRVVEFREAWHAVASDFDLAGVPVDGRTLKAASRLVGLSMRGELAGTGEVPMASRYGNRVSRSMAVVTLSNLTSAMRKHAPLEPVITAMCVFGVIAEAVRLTSDNAKLSEHCLRIPPVGTPVGPFAWTPAFWWPVLDAWGSSSKDVQTMVPNSWRLRPAEFDVAVWAACHATAWVGVCADVPDGRISDRTWSEHVALGMDGTWGMRMGSVWDLLQSTRPVSARVPFPSSYGSPCAFSRVDFTDARTLPWVPDRDES